MRHRVSQKKLNRTSAHRRAMQRNLAQSLFQHGQVCTTLAKAKDIRPFAERLITLAKKARSGSITARRQIHKLLADRSAVPTEHAEAYDLLSDAKRERVLRQPSGRRHRTGEPRGRLDFTAESIVHRLINTVAPRYEDRNGGYTRIIRLAKPRIGDHAPQAIIQLVGDEEGPGPVARPEKTARKRRADARYAFAIRCTKQTAKGESKQTAEATDAEGRPAAHQPTEDAESSAEAEDSSTRQGNSERGETKQE